MKLIPPPVRYSLVRLYAIKPITAFAHVCVIGMIGLLGVSTNAQLLHRYDFQTAGSANDTVGTANGTLYGTATVSGGALNTTGGAGTLSGGLPQNCVGLPVSAVADITNAFSIEVWYTANYNGPWCTLFSFSDSTTANYVLATPAAGYWPYPSRVAVIGGAGSGTEQVANQIYCDNAVLHNMIVTYDGTNVTYYLDGSLPTYSGLQNSFTDIGLVLSNMTYLGIAGGSPWGDNTLNGKVYDFRIYGQALTSAQVGTIYGLGTNASSAAITAALTPPTAFTWNGGGANDNWGTGLNWIGGTAPATSGTSLTFAGSTRTTPNLDANYSVTGLTFSNNAGNFTLGTANSSTLTLAGDLVNNSANAQTLNAPISLSVAAALNAASGNLVVNSNITLGASALAMTGNNNFTLNGSITGSGSFTKTGTGTLTMAGSTISAGSVSFNDGTTVVSGVVSGGGITYIGYTSGNGVLNLLSGTFNVGDDLRVGGSDVNGTGPNGTGTFTISGGAVNVGSLTVARGNNNQNSVSGSVTVNSGTTLTSTNDVILGFAGTGLGKVAINGGTFIIGPAATKWFIVGFYDSTAGELDITNGNLFLENGSSLKMCRGGNTGANVINQVGGAVTFYSDAGVTVGGTGNLDLNYAGGASSSDTYNLNGGILTVPQIITSSSSGASTFNFNGGILKAAANSTTFMQGLTAANVMAPGATIDTAGNNMTIAQALLDGDGLGGGLTKTGNGTLTLNGVNTYTGPTKVNAGTLAGTASIAGALINSATLAPGDDGIGTLTVNGNITLNAGSTNVFEVNGTTPANDSVIAGANVTYGGVLKIVASGPLTAGQQFVLFSGTGATNASNFASVQSATAESTFGFTNGVLTVISSMASNPTNITVGVSGNTMALLWPADHLGWTLYTNSVGVTANNQWFPLPGSSSVTSTNLTIDRNRTNVFFRLQLQ